MMARRIIALFGALVVCLGAWIVVEPQGLVQFADQFLTPGGLWFAVALRIAVGILLWVAAPTSRFPRTLRVLGVLFIASGIALPFVGLDRMLRVAEWGSGLDPLVQRSVGLVAAGIGAFLAWSVLPTRSEG